MEKLQLSIDGYKCYGQKTDISLNNLTVLSGANSAGKSSVIQTLLISKMVSESNSEPNGDTTGISLFDNKYALELGSYDEIVYKQSQTGIISIGLDGHVLTVKAEDNESENGKVFCRHSSVDKDYIKNLFEKGFSYLCADRMAPHYQYNHAKYDLYCDCHGSNVGDVIAKHEQDNADSKRTLGESPNIKWTIQLDEWVNYIFPGIDVRVKSSDETYKVIIRGDNAPNVGFGITYALPILVSGLIVPQNGILIVENPEAHLHPKAQSNMGYFLAKIASAGVRVIVETHSEHVVNGIRRMTVEKDSPLSHENISIYFFHNNQGNRAVKSITLDEWGNLSALPVDFFDQIRQDMLELIRLGKFKKNNHNG